MAGIRARSGSKWFVGSMVVAGVMGWLAGVEVASQGLAVGQTVEGQGQRIAAATQGAMERKLEPRDAVRVSVDELVEPQREYTLERVIDGNGDLQVLMLGRVHVGGLMPREAEAAIGQRMIAAGLLPVAERENPRPRVRGCCWGSGRCWPGR